MNFLIFLGMMAVATAQRPSYAGSSPKGRPGLGIMFQNPNATTTTVSLADRIGVNGTTPRIPIDARGDVDLVNRLNQWPRENRPFWLLNADHIEASRKTQRPQTRSDNRFGQQGNNARFDQQNRFSGRLDGDFQESDETFNERTRNGRTDDEFVDYYDQQRHTDNSLRANNGRRTSIF